MSGGSVRWTGCGCRGDLARHRFAALDDRLGDPLGRDEPDGVGDGWHVQPDRRNGQPAQLPVEAALQRGVGLAGGGAGRAGRGGAGQILQ